MEEMNRTKEQMKAIALHGCNLLVAAAAGSGKTSVLIERIFKMITSENPIDIDRLLVVTFTNAAAAEMRERMEKSLEEAFEENPDNKNLQKQIALLHKSHIMTIDSFCAEVLRNHFQEVDLDPSFRIADNTELTLLQEDVLADVLEECYQKAEEFPGFLQFMDSYAPGRSDEAAEAVILSVYRAATAYPDPKGWLLEKRKEVETIPITPLEKQEWMKRLLEFLQADLKSYQGEIERLITLCQYEEGLAPYQKTLESDLEVLNNLLLSDNYASFAKAFYYLSFEKLGRIKKADKEDLEPEQIKEIKDGRDMVKASVFAMKENYFPELSKERKGNLDIGEAFLTELREDLLGTVVPLLAMYDIVLAFMEAYIEAKRERNILDFSDQEHLALQILTKPDGSPSSAALELREYFEEILIDEYQDSNRLQEVILSAISKGRNMFLVGDVKQSIYKFRLARPELFMEKYHSYKTCNIEDTFGSPEAENHKIDLSKNFRSRKTVLDTVNYLFSRIMGKQMGNVTYDDAAALYAGREEVGSFPEQEDKSELLFITPEPMELSVSKEEEKKGSKRKKEKEQGKIELEAAHIAGRIKELVLSINYQNDNKIGSHQEKKIKYSDIAILLRTMSGWSEVFLKILQEAGIPAVTATAKGYFEASEVKVLLNLLKLIGNEQQDIPLAAVMLSPIGIFTEEELAIIRGMAAYKGIGEEKENKEDMLYDACLEFIAWQGMEIETENFNIALREKLRLFFEQINHFRNLAACLPVPELIEQILIMTGYDDCVLAMPDGEKRYGNIRVLIRKAEEFEKTSYHGLFQFNRYMERLKKYEVDFGEADAVTNIDAVQIMSIHKSKGLEFPIVFVSGLGKQFNFMDTRKSIVIHQELFAGADFVDLKKRIQVPTVVKKVLQHDMIMETLGEELRVLYVAMTRAREKLILTGYIEKPKDKVIKWLSQGSVGKLPIHVLGNAKTFLDLVMPVFLQKRPPEEKRRTGFDYCNIEVKESNYHTLLLQAAASENTREWKRQELLHHQELSLQEDSYEDYYQEILSQIEKEYPYEATVRLKTKFTVSELKRAAMEEWETPEDNLDGAYLEEEETLFSWNPEYAIIDVPDTDTLLLMDSVSELERGEKLIPSFIKPKEEQNIGGIMVGTLYHEVMRRLDFLHIDTMEMIQMQLEDMKKKEILTQEGLFKIKIKKIMEFLSCSIGKRICYAQRQGKLFREQPFVMGMDASIFIEESKKREEKEETEMVLVQGVIDLFFEEDGKLILLDYKTDHVKQEEELKERYYKQLEYYAQALERTRKLPVEEKYLYSFHLGKLILCE